MKNKSTMLDPIFEFDQIPVQISNPTKQINRKPTKSPQNHDKCVEFDSENVQFNAANSEDESGESSPPLWKTYSGVNSSNSSYFQGNYQNLSPNSRVQAIARGQRELMEMVKNMPESCYELSLRDIVEHHRVGGKNPCLDGERIGGKQSENVIKRSESGGKMTRSSSSDHNNGGFLLKMVFPVSLSWKKKKKKKKKNSGPNSGSKISPKPENSNKSSKLGDNQTDWWGRRRFSGSDERESVARIGSNGSSSSNGSRVSSRNGSNNSSSRRKKSGCSPCYCSMGFLSSRNKKGAK